MGRTRTKIAYGGLRIIYRALSTAIDNKLCGRASRQLVSSRKQP
jgi:hypothetical protein